MKDDTKEDVLEKEAIMDKEIEKEKHLFVEDDILARWIDEN